MTELVMVLGCSSPGSLTKGVVLVHCNAGVSRAPAVIIGYLMSCEGQTFADALSLVKSVRGASSPNPGFLEQLRSYKTPTINGSKH
ncbi:hypothetical protein FQN60_001592 [Etheostoma spectabile]|uniref:Tyrosine specific protein phosphatases domain-containing protein n=1 Tax=Etheostoma spectabile TaxID=54343 RepID=A0A5J5D0X5_9PERO|nr:hypothetical protein FQN60_001592 [Etheostoma spectabile]